MGRKLMESGAEIYRVEESVSRLLSAYGVQAQVFAIPNCLIVSVTALEGQPITQITGSRPMGQILNCWSGAMICAVSCAGKSRRWKRRWHGWRSWRPTAGSSLLRWYCCWAI